MSTHQQTPGAVRFGVRAPGFAAPTSYAWLMCLSVGSVAQALALQPVPV